VNLAQFRYVPALSKTPSRKAVGNMRRRPVCRALISLISLILPMLILTAADAQG